MEKEYIEMTVKELRDYIENMPDGTVVSVEADFEETEADEFERECINLVKDEYPQDDPVFEKVLYADDIITIMLFRLEDKEMCFTVTHADGLLKGAVSTAEELVRFAGGER